jgi:hypothetical protein
MREALGEASADRSDAQAVIVWIVKHVAMGVDRKISWIHPQAPYACRHSSGANKRGEQCRLICL